MISKPPEYVSNVWELVDFLDKELGNKAFQSWTPFDFVTVSMSSYNYSELDLALKQKKLIFYPNPSIDVNVLLSKGSRLWRTNTYLYSVVRALDSPGNSSDRTLANLIAKTKGNLFEKRDSSNEKAV